jgi:hypothetical protein
MRRFGLVVLWIFALAGAVMVGSLALVQIENQSSHFANYDELKASGLIERGWIPEHIPRSVKSVNESHDVSSYSGGGTFTYDPSDTAIIQGKCQRLAETERGSKFLCPPHDGKSFLVVLRVDGSGSWELISDAI